jgi:hypothetical protein
MFHLYHETLLKAERRVVAGVRADGASARSARDAGHGLRATRRLMSILQRFVPAPRGNPPKVAAS